MLGPRIRRSRRLKKIEEQNQLKFRPIHVRKGDRVKVLSGKDRGKEGKVLKTVKDKSASYALPTVGSYVRARVRSGKMTAYTQAYFPDGASSSPRGK